MTVSPLMSTKHKKMICVARTPLTNGEHELSLLDAALRYGCNGFDVLPLYEPSGNGCSCSKGKECKHPGKHPRTAHGAKDASKDPEVIRELVDQMAQRSDWD